MSWDARRTWPPTGCTRWSAWTSGCAICSLPPPLTAPRSPGCRHRGRWPQAQARLRAVQRKAARQDGPDRRTGRRGLQAVGADRGADRADPRPGRRPAPRRAAPGHHAAGAAAPGDRGRGPERGRHVAPQARRRPGGRGLNRALADAALGELRRQLGYKTTWYGSQLAGRGPVVSQLEDLLGLRRGESQARPGRPDLPV